MIYVDDTFLGGDEFEECRANVTKILQCLKNLGFFIHSHESIFIPTQNIYVYWLSDKHSEDDHNSN